MGFLPDVAKSDGQLSAIHLGFALGIALSHSFHHGHLYHGFLRGFVPRLRPKYKHQKSSMLSQLTQFFVSHQNK